MKLELEDVATSHKHEDPSVKISHVHNADNVCENQVSTRELSPVEAIMLLYTGIDILMEELDDDETAYLATLLGI